MIMKKNTISLLIPILIMSLVLLLTGCSGNGQGGDGQSSGNESGYENNSGQNSGNSSDNNNNSDTENNKGQNSGGGNGSQNSGGNDNGQNGSGQNGGNNGSGNAGNTADKCEITAFSIGKADSLLISSGDVNILIDTGEEDDAEYICSAIREKDINKLNIVMITHFDKDHVGGISKILQEFDADQVIYPDYANTKDGYLAFRRAISDRGNDGKITAITEYSLGDLKLVVYPEDDPNALRAKSNDFDNDMSLVCMLYYRDYRFLFAGDIEKDRIDEILDAGIDIECDWVKMPHHGRYNKKIKKLLDACTPSYAIVTDSDDLVADTDTLVELQKRKAKIFSTRNGGVVTVADENGISVNYAE